MTKINKTMAIKFADYDRAQDWALTNGRDHAHAHQFWRVEKDEDLAAFVVAVRSRNSQELHHYATAD